MRVGANVVLQGRIPEEDGWRSLNNRSNESYIKEKNRRALYFFGQTAASDFEIYFINWTCFQLRRALSAAMSTVKTVFTSKKLEPNPTRTLRHEMIQCQGCWRSKADVALKKCAKCFAAVYCVSSIY
jgi:hypothetical protein